MWRRKALRENPYLNRKEFSQESRRRREQTIADWFRDRGSQAFINWLENSYRTHQDRAIEWDEPFFRALAELLGNPWLQCVIVIKAAQLGFSELLIALCGFALAYLRSPCLFAVERANKRPDAGSRIQKTFDFTPEIAEYRDRAKTKRKRQDRDTKTEGVEVAGVPLHLRAVAKSDDSAGVDPKLSSFPAEILVADEIERWPQGALDVICQRSSRSSLPNPLILRAGSTPGGEGGITNTAVRLSSHFFDWQVRCSHCQQTQFLHPFGNVARATKVAVEGDRQITRYINEEGNPIDWFCRDRATLESRVESAYLGCQHCGEEIDPTTIADGKYVCCYTGESLADFNQRTLAAAQPFTKSVAVQMPRLASTRFKLRSRLADILSSRDKTDGWQQGFGIAVSLGGGRIDKSRLMEATAIASPEGEPDLVVVGVDQGGAYHLATVSYWWWDEAAAEERDRVRAMGSREQGDLQWYAARRQLISYHAVPGRQGIVDLCRRVKADILGFDGRPEAELTRDLLLGFSPKRDSQSGPVCRLHRDRRSRLERDWLGRLRSRRKFCAENLQMAIATLDRDLPPLPQMTLAMENNVVFLAQMLLVSPPQTPSDPIARYWVKELGDRFPNVPVSLLWVAGLPLDRHLVMRLAHRAIDSGEVPELEAIASGVDNEENYWDNYGMAFAFYQTNLEGRDFDRKERVLHGETVPVWSIDRTVWLDAVRDRFYRGQVSLPPGIEDDPKNRDSYIYQMLASRRTSDTAKWEEPSGEPDHYFHAESFGEAAAMVWRYEN